MDITLIPETAPFSTEQRAWLNGFLAGWLGLTDGAPAPGAFPSGMPALAPPAPHFQAEPEPEPWHDPALPIDERLKLADGKPLQHRLMAAMAQLDCGSCGYLCRTYSEAIASGAESSLTLCSPGGSETSKLLKRLVKETKPGANGTSNGASKNGVAKPVEHAWTRKNPFSAVLLRSVVLNAPGSEKETRHVEIDLSAGGPSYEVGDSLGVYPENCPELADELIATLGARGDEPVPVANGAEVTLREALIRHRCLSEVGEELLERLADSATDDAEAAAIRGLIDDESSVTGFDVLDVLQLFPTARPAPEDVVAALAALKPRLYSISSSPKRHAGEVHLTVRRVSYEFNGRGRKGVASTMLADRVTAGSALRVFVQKSHGFTIPADPRTPIIMIGPGTGIAPFRAFLYEREAIGAKGNNWLFFGDQRSTLDFLYEDELEDLLRREVLTRLDTAFSRDQTAKLYVQHRILEHGQEFFDWLENGAHVYVCGDAKRMAADVDAAIHVVLRRHGAMSDEAASEYVAKLAATKRYCRDVY